MRAAAGRATGQRLPRTLLATTSLASSTVADDDPTQLKSTVCELNPQVHRLREAVPLAPRP
ncbi:hypothetical protein WN71_008270 [Streptomyces mangrovisoli]|uniref:Uncharacterized protein n=1 Tax=Streptomyces mangrovisoli TaxID=1428628 RepID=A0A1J4P3S1_9ACTN|nr:hypothetical protein WN71_008270 [Streptomyces mangrovisoli]